MKVDVLVVGCGFAGCVVAERCASSGKSVLVIDKREHIAGNAYDEKDQYGVFIHRYGPHIFHTNSPVVANYLSRFTSWRDYEHRVLASVENKLLPLPINRTTINRLYGMDLTEEGVTNFLESVRENRDSIRTSEDVVLASVGKDLCEKFFRHYTKKQWGLELSELSAGVAARIPTRTNDDDRYFTDSFQKMPADGYTAMFARLLEHPNIRVELGTDFFDARARHSWDHLFYSGPIDGYFSNCFGKLPYRSLRFEHEHLSRVAQFQPVGTVNYPNEHEFTRITEFKHLTGQVAEGTSIVREYPSAVGDPYYPIPTESTQELYSKYSSLAQGEANVQFIGRLAQYRYYNMDQVIAAALKASDAYLGSNSFGAIA